MDVYPKQPTVQSWNFTIQRELGAGWTAEVGYVGTRGHTPASHHSVESGLLRSR
jgi:hypothetical protein